MGGQGSGELQAMIDQATRLDAFTDALYQWKGGTPTPDDYASVAGYPSATAFKWEISVQETMKEMGPEIRETWLKAHPDSPLTDEQLKIMLGKSEGWGALQYEYNKSLEEEQKAEIAQKAAMDIEKIRPIYGTAEQGGFKEALPGLADIGSM
jgi:hypothetical protein